MRLILGVDPEGRYRSALTLLSRLNFADAELTMVHVDEKSDFPVALPSAPTFTGRPGQTLTHEHDVHVLKLAEEEGREAGMKVAIRYDLGRPSERLMEQATDVDANLVVIGSKWPRASIRESLGSVERAFVHDFGRSFLVTHGAVAPEGKVRIVFATDHSEFGDAALERLLDWDPRGVEEIVLTTAVEPHGHSLLHRLFHRDADQDPAELIDDLLRRSNSLAERIRAAGFEARVRVQPGKVEDVLRQVVEETGADMVVMGARGHSATERLIAGSVAQQQVLHAAYPVVVIRR